MKHEPFRADFSRSRLFGMPLADRHAALTAACSLRQKLPRRALVRFLCRLVLGKDVGQLPPLREVSYESRFFCVFGKRCCSPPFLLENSGVYLNLCSIHYGARIFQMILHALPTRTHAHALTEIFCLLDENLRRRIAGIDIRSWTTDPPRLGRQRLLIRRGRMVVIRVLAERRRSR